MHFSGGLQQVQAETATLQEVLAAVAAFTPPASLPAPGSSASAGTTTSGAGEFPTAADLDRWRRSHPVDPERKERACRLGQHAAPCRLAQIRRRQLIRPVERSSAMRTAVRPACSWKRPWTWSTGWSPVPSAGGERRMLLRAGDAGCPPGRADRRPRHGRRRLFPGPAGPARRGRADACGWSRASRSHTSTKPSAWACAPGFGDDWLRIGGVKMFADGALGPRTAWMLEGFDSAPENTGIATTDIEVIHAAVSRANAARPGCEHPRHRRPGQPGSAERLRRSTR